MKSLSPSIKAARPTPSSSATSTHTLPSGATDLDGQLITWGDRLFYPGNRIVGVRPAPRLDAAGSRQRAAALRQRIVATVARRVPQVMVKVTGGGRCMAAIAAHFRYISRNGRLDIEDQRGDTLRGKGSLHNLADEWRYGGSRIPEEASPGQRREAFNIMLSMPRGTDPLAVQRAARAFAQTELAGHKYLMVLHDHQANPHVHISVRAESTQGRRLNPRKADLHRWRETFAEKLRDLGVEAEASRQATRGQQRRPEPLWRLKAQEEGRYRGKALKPAAGREQRQQPEQRAALQQAPDALRSTAVERQSHQAAKHAWGQLAQVLAGSGQEDDARLSRSITDFVQRTFEGRVPAQQAPVRDRSQELQRSQGQGPTLER